jgi:phage baseplate assembly protein W
MAGIFRKNLFVGYSSVSAPKSLQLVDLALVKQDLLNHFNTSVMMPGWGCGVWEYLFEPFDEATKDSVVLEVRQVIDSDPRVTIRSINVTEMDHGIRVDMILNYTPLNAAAEFSVNFDRRSLTMT